MSEQKRGSWQPIQTLAGMVVLVVSAGCATAPGGDARDPWEPYNRSMTSFNDAVDDAVLKPVATVYRDVLPQPVRTGFGNFFGNLGDVWSFVNNVLQAKPEGSLHSFWRVVVNSTIGLGGVLDPATEMRLERHREDFGQTLGRWGVPPGPYFVIPLLGPSTVRDTAASASCSAHVCTTSSRIICSRGPPPRRMAEVIPGAASCSNASSIAT